VLSKNLSVAVERDNLSRVRVTASNLMRTNVRGLCGYYNGESVNDFEMPNGQVENQKQFTQSWSVPCNNEFDNCVCTKDTCVAASSDQRSSLIAADPCQGLKEQPIYQTILQNCSILKTASSFTGEIHNKLLLSHAKCHDLTYISENRSRTAKNTYRTKHFYYLVCRP